MSDYCILSQKKVTTRKPHVCQACGILYPIGVQMDVVNQVLDGKLASSYWCATCQAFLALQDPLDVFDAGFDRDIWEWEGYREFQQARAALSPEAKE